MRPRVFSCSRPVGSRAWSQHTSSGRRAAPPPASRVSAYLADGMSRTMAPVPKGVSVWTFGKEA